MATIANKLGGSDPKSQQPSPPHFHIWDSRYGPTTEAFSVFRETICRTFMPWTPETKSNSFEGRVESISLESGVVGRVQMSPIVASKTKHDIADSAYECIHGNFIVSGQLEVLQGDRYNIAKSGDLILYHGFSPVKLTVKPDEPFDNIAFIIPKSRFSTISTADDKFHNRLLSNGMRMGPLYGCLASIANNLHSFTPSEISSVFEACVALLPLAAGCFGENARMPEIRGNAMLRELRHFINDNISEPDLSPRLAAKNLGISARYVHKLLAEAGTTFRSYVTAERLEHIGADLIAANGGHVSVSLLAFQWGFNDLSTFNRAFRDHFGCNPSQFRGFQMDCGHGTG